MKTIEQARRELFEAWASEPPFEFCLDRYDGDGTWPGNYRNYSVECAWQGFNAALDAVEIELPGPGAAMASVFDYQHSTRNKKVTGTTNWAANVGMVVVDDCRAAIESTNLGLKIT